jgi:hypothetical protein
MFRISLSRKAKIPLQISEISRREGAMVREFERHHAWRFPCSVPTGFGEIMKSGGEGESWRLHLV